jgi:hypothetical protein
MSMTHRANWITKFEKKKRKKIEGQYGYYARRYKSITEPTQILHSRFSGKKKKKKKKYYILK